MARPGHWHRLHFQPRAAACSGPVSVCGSSGWPAYHLCGGPFGSISRGAIDVRRLEGSHDSGHYLERDELTGLKALRRHYAANGIKSAYVFVNDERGQPFGRMGIARIGVCLGGEGHGHAPAATLPRPRQPHQHGALHHSVARVVQGRMALERAAIASGRPLMREARLQAPREPLRGPHASRRTIAPAISGL
jgi:hypothetical protein